MALEAVVFPTLDPFSYGCKGGGWSYDFDLQEEDKALLGILGNNTEPGSHGNWDSSSPSVMQNAMEWDHNSSPEACTGDQSLAGVFPPTEEPPSTSTTGRRKRRRTKSCKNKEEVENQRMTHIAVERNRRKQMNEYLAVLRSLMPPSYTQRVPSLWALATDSILDSPCIYVGHIAKHLPGTGCLLLNSQKKRKNKKVYL